MTHTVRIGNIEIGGQNPVIIQSMTDTDTSDVSATVRQIIELNKAGAEMVRLAVNTIKAAKAIPHIRDKLYSHNCTIPLIGCFHYNGHVLLSSVSECAQYLDKYRINPGNVGTGREKDEHFATVIDCALKYNKPIRIGVNWGSLDQKLATDMLDSNAILKHPRPLEEVIRDVVVQSALLSAKRCIERGLPSNKIVLSAKVSGVPDLLYIYKRLAKESNYALHLGLTEAGSGYEGAVTSAIGISLLLQQEIGDTIRVSLTPKPNESRATEVVICQAILRALALRQDKPHVISCPGCGRTDSNYFRQLAEEIKTFITEQMPIWATQYPKVMGLRIAVMGCIVNGPGESKHADIGICLPGKGENHTAQVFVEGEKRHILQEPDIAGQFKDILLAYIRGCL